MTTTDNKALLRSFFAHLDRNDLEAAAAMLSPDVRAFPGNVPGPLSREVFAEFGKAFVTGFTHARHDIQAQVSEGDLVATRMVWTGIHSGVFNGVPASGRSVTLNLMCFSTIVGGKITEHRVDVDVMSLMSQIGAVPVAA